MLAQRRGTTRSRGRFFVHELQGMGAHRGAMGVWGMALLTVTLVGASAILGKKLGSIFRV